MSERSNGSSSTRVTAVNEADGKRRRQELKKMMRYLAVGEHGAAEGCCSRGN